jgi:hypothetical protein
MSLPNWVKPERRKAFSRSGNEARAAKRMALGADADTLRSRALYDARGRTIRQGCDYSAAGEKHWVVIRSVRGRTDQIDLLRNGRLFRTGGIRQASHAIKFGVWPKKRRVDKPSVTTSIPS